MSDKTDKILCDPSNRKCSQARYRDVDLSYGLEFGNFWYPAVTVDAPNSRCIDSPLDQNSRNLYRGCGQQLAAYCSHMPPENAKIIVVMQAIDNRTRENPLICGRARVHTSHSDVVDANLMWNTSMTHLTVNFTRQQRPKTIWNKETSVDSGGWFLIWAFLKKTLICASSEDCICVCKGTKYCAVLFWVGTPYYSIYTSASITANGLWRAGRKRPNQTVGGRRTGEVKKDDGALITFGLVQYVVR